MKIRLPIAALPFALVACSSPTNQAAPANVASADTATPDTTFTPPAAPGATPTPSVLPTPSPRTLTLEGLGPLQIGEAIPPGSGWEMDPNCSAASSRAYPGVYALVEQDAVRRITVGAKSDVKLIEGIGVGASEQAVDRAFPGFVSTPHKYEPAPAKYLTAPNADRGGPALRFEIGTDGKVKAMHVGVMPALGYAEGCG